MPRPAEIVAAGDAGKRLDRWFKDHYPDFPFARLQKSMRKGEIRLNGKRVKGNERLEADDQIRVPPFADKQAGAPKPASTPRLPDDIVQSVKSWVLYEDDLCFVLNKPPGLATQGGSGQGNRHLDAYLDAFQRIDGCRPKLVHRLDKDTSGAILVARTQKSATLLAKAFQARTAEKTYLAVVKGLPDPRSGEIFLKMEKAPGPGGEKMIVDDEDGKPSRTLFETLDHAGKEASVVALRPLTGRTHQLRLHLSVIGCPIVGDGKYGGQDAFLTGSISRKLHLHSARIRVAHPAGGFLDVPAPVSAHVKDTLAGLGLDAKNLDGAFDDDPPNR